MSNIMEQAASILSNIQGPSGSRESSIDIQAKYWSDRLHNIKNPELFAKLRMEIEMTLMRYEQEDRELSEGGFNFAV
ncbi:hypothetical protein JTE90_019973 [Oedothorax gibbosus]|uniref:Uncharacterized protein n=1 Tax=Oedothorax gibbosus TaxID=931172 RepID=A0AAV6TJ27_9ARAC|nr:hypothetical protein JTE90_019973 [Oedothorax gibbosus]